MPRAIEETIGYLMVQVMKAHRHTAADLLNELGLHVGQEIFLMELEDGMRPSDMGCSLGVQPATITKMLQRMERSGLVARKPDPDDARSSLLYLTDKSRRMLKDIELAWQELEERTIANLTTEEQVLFRRVLVQILENLNS